MTSSPIPKNPAIRRVWIVWRLVLAGSSLADIARSEGVSRQAVSDALARGSSERLERAIARKLSLPAARLFCERYDIATGHRQPRHLWRDGTGSDAARHEQNGRAA